MERRKRNFLIVLFILVIFLAVALFWYFYIGPTLIYLFVILLSWVIAYYLPVNPLSDPSTSISYQLWLHERQSRLKEGDH